MSLMCATQAPCELVLHPGGDHHVLKQGKPSHRLDGVRRIVDWVTRWVEVPLGNGEQAEAGGAGAGQRSDAP